MIVNFMGRDWQWNPLDKKLVQVNDWIKDLHEALKFIPQKRRDIAIQAGGAMGMWPHELSFHFRSVRTFEPDAGNYKCLVANCADRTNISHTQAGLGAYDGFISVELPPSEANNAGAYYTMPAREGVDPAHSVPQFSLDSLYDEGNFDDGRVDFIQLDVEGRELDVLLGAIGIIERDAPVIMLEDKPLPQDRFTGHKFGEVERVLTREMGYKVAKKVHRDIILIPGA